MHNQWAKNLLGWKGRSGGCWNSAELSKSPKTHRSVELFFVPFPFPLPFPASLSPFPFPLPFPLFSFLRFHSHYRRFVGELTHISKPLQRLDEKRKPLQESTAWFSTFQNWKGSLWLLQLTYFSESFCCWTPPVQLLGSLRTQVMLLKVWTLSGEINHTLWSLQQYISSGSYMKEIFSDRR